MTVRSLTSLILRIILVVVVAFIVAPLLGDVALRVSAAIWNDQRMIQGFFNPAFYSSNDFTIYRYAAGFLCGTFLAYLVSTSRLPDYACVAVSVVVAWVPLEFVSLLLDTGTPFNVHAVSAKAAFILLTSDTGFGIILAASNVIIAMLSCLLVYS